jgi:exopolysaccharide production protein ExoQ
VKLPPSIAACLFVGFILWLFRRYSKEAGAMSYGLWVPFIWVAINVSRPIGYWFANGTEAAASETADLSQGSFIDRNTYLILICAGVFVLLRRRVNWSSFLASGRWLWIFYFYLLLSVLWSDYTFISFKRWFKDAGDLVMILIILSEKDPIEAIRGIFIRCAYLLVPLSVLFIKWYPDIGRYYNPWTWKTGYSGITLGKNQLGVLAMLSGLFLLWQIVDVYPARGIKTRLRNLWPDLLVLVMCLWMLWIADSATALYSFLLGVLVFFGIRLRLVRTNFSSLGWIFAGVALVMLVFTISLGFRGVIAGLFGRDVTLTERTIIWENVLKLGTNPLIGSGFSSTWLTYYATPIVQDYHLAHSHNGYLETYLHTGLIGVLLLLAVLASAGRNARRQLSQRSNVGYLFFSLFLVALFYNYTEVTFNRSNVVGMLLWLMSAYGVAVTSEQDKEVILTDVGKSSSFANIPALADEHSPVTEC